MFSTSVFTKLTMAIQMTAVSLVLILLFVPTARAGTDMDSVKCDANETCPIEQFCSPDGFCEMCVPCEKHYNRQSPPPPINGTSCAKKEEQCGPCLPGYNQTLTYDSTKIECFQIPTPSTSYQWHISIIYFLLSVISLLLIVIGYILRKELKKIICCCCFKKLPSTTNLIRDPNSGNQSNGQLNSALDERCTVLDGNNVVTYQSQTVNTRQQN